MQMLTLLEMLWGRVNELESCKLVSTLLKSLDDLADEIALNAVGLQGRDDAYRKHKFISTAAMWLNDATNLDHDVGTLFD